MCFISNNAGRIIVIINNESITHTSQYILRECVLCMCESGNANKLCTLSPINILVLFCSGKRVSSTDVIKCKQMGRSLKACFQSNEGNIYIMCTFSRGSEKFKLSTKSGHFSAGEDIAESVFVLCSLFNFTTTGESH
jgi:hypothetical protein